VIYRIDDQRRLVTVIAIEHRSDVYRHEGSDRSATLRPYIFTHGGSRDQQRLRPPLGMGGEHET
jgi:hypothetical protein